MYSELLIMIIVTATLATATMLRQQLRREFIFAEANAPPPLPVRPARRAPED
jgi:hypothetical protein